MKKKELIIKKVLAAALSAAMVLSMAACGNEDGGSSSSGSDAQQGQAEESSSEDSNSDVASNDGAADDASEETPQEPEYDFGGRVLRIGSYYDMTPNPEDSALEALLAERIAFVEENYNCKIEFVVLDDYVTEYVTSVLAGDPVVDIGYHITSRVLPSLIEGGIVYPVSDLNNIDLTDYKWRPDVTEAGYYKGKNYTFLLKDPEIRYGIFWNKTLFGQNGLPDLYELVEKDEWTWEKFKEIAAAANKDTDSDGTVDIHGFACRENLSWCYLYSNGAYACEKTDTGIDVDLSDPSVVEALTALQDFTTTVDYRNAIDWSTEGWDAMITGFRDGDTMMLLEEFWVSYAYFNSDENPMSDDWGWVPFPKGPSATDWSCYGKENGCRVILNGVEDPEEGALIYDLITDIADTNEEWDNLMEDVLEGWANDAKTVELVTYINDNKLSVLNAINGFGTLNSAIGEMVGKVTSGEMTPQTALDTYQSQIDAAIADLENYDYDAEMQEYLQTEEEGEGEGEDEAGEDEAGEDEAGGDEAEE